MWPLAHGDYPAGQYSGRRKDSLVTATATATPKATARCERQAETGARSRQQTNYRRRRLVNNNEPRGRREKRAERTGYKLLDGFYRLAAIFRLW